MSRSTQHSKPKATIDKAMIDRNVDAMSPPSSHTYEQVDIHVYPVPMTALDANVIARANSAVVSDTHDVAQRYATPFTSYHHLFFPPSLLYHSYSFACSFLFSIDYAAMTATATATTNTNTNTYSKAISTILTNTPSLLNHTHPEYRRLPTLPVTPMARTYFQGHATGT